MLRFKELENDLQQELKAISPYLHLRRSPRARRFALRLDSRKRVVHLVVPKRASLKKAHIFALENERWIHDKLKTLPPLKSMGHGAVIPLLGQERVIRIFYDKTLKKTDILLKEKEIHISTNKEDPQNRLMRTLKNVAREELGALARQKACTIGKTVSNIRIGDPKSLWGSCSPAGNISFSWRLVLAPPHAMDYVVAHEIAHLKHLDHSPRFWALCRELSENYEDGKSWMKKNGNSLLQYG